MPPFWTLGVKLTVSLPKFGRSLMLGCFFVSHRLSALPGGRRPSVWRASFENPASWSPRWCRLRMSGHPSGHPIPTCPADCSRWVSCPHHIDGYLHFFCPCDWTKCFFDKKLCCQIERTGNKSIMRVVWVHLDPVNGRKGKWLVSTEVLGWVTQAQNI